MSLRGLATTIYSVPDLARAKEWYSTAFEAKPYFDEPFYVGFDIAGYELGLLPSPDQAGAGGSVAYWRVDEIDTAVAKFNAAGARTIEEPKDVGEGVKVACVADPFGNLIGLIENPYFDLSKYWPKKA